MNPRIRKLIGLVGILAFMAAYVAAAATVSDHLPDGFWVRLLYYVVVGSGWFVPIMPLIAWMNGAPKEKAPPANQERPEDRTDS